MKCLQQELESSVEAIESLREEKEQLNLRTAEVEALLQECRLECDAQRSIINQLQTDRESLSAPPAPRVLIACPQPLIAVRFERRPHSVIRNSIAPAG